MNFKFVIYLSIQTGTILLGTTMTTLIDRVVGVAGVCLYTCKLGIFFVMPLTLPIPIYEIISLRGALETCQTLVVT